MLTTLFLHLVKVREWRARAKAMKEFEEDKTDASEASDEPDEDIASEESDDDDEFIEDDDSEGVIEEEYDDEEEDAIDIGSHIGLVFDDEEVFGTIIEFDDEEETVTIEEDETGDIITGYQEDMFLE